MNPATAVLDVHRMAEADRLTVASGIGAADLMENAGRAVAREITRRWPAQAVLVLCGPGGNGGDGFVVARHLADAGWTVQVALLGPRDELRGAALEKANRWAGAVGGLAPELLAQCPLIVDAIVGAGLNRALGGAARETLAAAAAARLTIVAVDVPSGLQGDTGADLGAVACALTVTFFRKKPAHLLLPGRALCGEVVVADIGTPGSVLSRIAPDLYENDPRLWAAELPLLRDQANKYTRGHALVMGGYPMTGAARMAARAAARVGAGLTTVAVPAVALPIYAAALTSIMVRPLTAAADFETLIADPRITGLLIGPGAGAGEETRARTLALLATGRAVLVDADALTSFQDEAATLFRAIRGPCVFTPHEGEFRRLFSLTGDKLARARAAAKISGAVIVLKGSDTVIAAPDGRAIINANAPATLATAGSGDVLGGIVLGLLAQGMDAFAAAAAGVWLHGAAAALFGPGLLAEDLPDLLPRVLRELATDSGTSSASGSGEALKP